MLRKSAILLILLGLLSACGYTREERLVSGALIGGMVGAAVGVMSEPQYSDYRRPGRGYGRHDRGYDDGYRRHDRDYDDDYD